MKQKKINGLVVAPFTPMKSGGEINLDMIPTLYETYARNGVIGAFINGSTGEGLSLTTNERKNITKVWSEIVSRDFKLLVHVGHTSLEDAKELARHSSSLNVSGVSVVSPFYMKPTSVEDLVDYCAEIASCIPQTPFYYYHIPALTGVHFLMSDFLKVAKERIPTLAGIKFTDSDLNDYCVSYNYCNNRYDLMFGNDELLICGRLMGACGYIGSTYNLFPQLYLEIINAFDNGDLEKARNLQYKSILYVRTIGTYGYGSASKAVMKLVGLDCGPARLPLQKFDYSQLTELEEKLSDIGFFDYAIQKVQEA
ncbi:MAG: dihydrodipicolinate synthase family protein [Balneolales bacterium]